MGKKRATSASGPAGTAKAKARKTSEELVKLSNQVMNANPHVKMLEEWMSLSPRING